MPKNICSCADDSNKEFVNETPTFRTHYHLDNTFIPVFQNPSRVLRNLVQNGAPSSLVDRDNCLTCDENVSTQDKLKVRKKDRPTPYRVPFNHFRKITSCKEDCITNVKIIKDLSCNNLDCVPTTYALSRLVDKNGVRNLNNGGNYKNYLQSSGKEYYLNTAGILPDNLVPGKTHMYKIGSLENTVSNINSGTKYTNDCQLGYSHTISQNDKSFSYKKINTTVKKYSNPSHKTSGSVSSKAHLHKKKFRSILSGQSVGKKDGYNNCINGQICSLYMKPGPNTKLFMGKTSKQRCIPPRIRGMKQTCVSNISCESSKFINPRFQREDYTTGQDAGFMKITIDHCPLNAGDIILIKFSGYPTTINSVFTPNTNTNASSAITSAIFVGSNGTINLTISNLFVNGNTLYWVMPINVGTGTIQITIDDGPSETNFITTNNGPTGTVYANVNVPRHRQVTSSSAWNIVNENNNQSSTLSNLSLLPANFLGTNRSGAGSIGLSDGFQGISHTWQRTLKGRYGYDANQISKSSFRVTLKFTTSSGISSGDTIKLIMKRPYDDSITNNEIFRVTNNTWTYSGQNGITMGVENNNWIYIELKSGETEKEISALSLGNYNTSSGSQELTLTVGENIPASDICIIFYDFDSSDDYHLAGGNWQYNVKDGTALTFDLEVTGHATSTNNLGWYAQDITALDRVNNTTFSNLRLFKSFDEVSPNDGITTIIYRHYSAIPQNSKIRLIFRTEHIMFATDDDKYKIFKTDPNNNNTFTGASSIVNTSTPSPPGEGGEGGECGIWVTSKDLNNSSTSNNITIGSFTIGGLVKAAWAQGSGFPSYSDANHGSVEYLEFTVTQQGGIPGDTVTGTSAGGKYIEININARQAITNILGSHSNGKVHFSIEVLKPSGGSYYDLIGGGYSLEGETDGAFTIALIG